MAEREQVRPLAPAANGYLRNGYNDGVSSGTTTPLPVKRIRRRRRCIKCCGCIIAFILLLAVIIIILAFTVFKVRDPKIRLNSIRVIKLELINNNTTPKPGTNISLSADVSVKNPNPVSFRYTTNTTATLYYRGTVAGEALVPPGFSKARRTMRIDLKADLITNNIMSIPNITADLGTGILAVNSYARVPGKVKILGFKKRVVVKMNCSFTANVTAIFSSNMTTQAIQDVKCKKKIEL